MYDNNSTKVVIGPVRLSYVNVIKPRVANPGEEPRYSATLIIPKDNAEMIAKIKAAVTNAYNAATATFGGKLPPINTIKLPGKWKRMGVYTGKTPATKKAVVTLTADSKKIEIFENMI